MTEPIKLPPDPLVTMNKATLDRQIAYAVEQATAEWKADLRSADEIIRHLQEELAQAQAALARLTTLRPASEWDGDLAIWRYKSHPRYLVSDKDCETYDLIGWTPLPPVKEADK
jgi:hypothetical protein